MASLTLHAPAVNEAALRLTPRQRMKAARLTPAERQRYLERIRRGRAAAATDGHKALRAVVRQAQGLRERLDLFLDSFGEADAPAWVHRDLWHLREAMADTLSRIEAVVEPVR